jgi:hypothetical protein
MRFERAHAAPLASDSFELRLTSNHSVDWNSGLRDEYPGDSVTTQAIFTLDDYSMEPVTSMLLVGVLVPERPTPAGAVGS